MTRKKILGDDDEYHIYSYLRNYIPDNPDFSKEELTIYLNNDLWRFIQTVRLIPKNSGKILEIGSFPYYTTLLVKKYITHEITCINFFGKNHPSKSMQIFNGINDSTIEIPYLNINIEDGFPKEMEGKYQTVLFCEVIEHLITDPLPTIIAINQLLKPGGYLILTTPNVARWSNRIKLLLGLNIYDFYSQNGIYWRHNREYTQKELVSLLQKGGFFIEKSFTYNTYPNLVSDLKTRIIGNLVLPFNKWRNTFGFYHFIVARKFNTELNESPYSGTKLI